MLRRGLFILSRRHTSLTRHAVASAAPNPKPTDENATNIPCYNISTQMTKLKNNSTLSTTPSAANASSSQSSFHYINPVRFRSPLTNDAFNPDQQKILEKAATMNSWSAPYWATWAQIRRAYNGEPKVLEHSTTIYAGESNLYPFEALLEIEQDKIMAANPPWFPTGTGIYRGRNRWTNILSPHFEKILNPNREVRKLFVDGKFIEQEGIQLKQGAFPENFEKHFPVSLFNADQLVVPARGFPLRGLSLTTDGRRILQPAHDILLAHSVLRNYPSPYWLTQSDIQKAGVKLDLSRAYHANAEGKLVPSSVTASTMQGLAIPLSCCHDEVKTHLEMLTAATDQLIEHDAQFYFNEENDDNKSSQHSKDYHSLRRKHSGPTLIFSCAGWERVRRLTFLSKFEELASAHATGAQISHWVNIDEAIPLLPLSLRKSLGITAAMRLSEARWNLIDPSVRVACQEAFEKEEFPSSKLPIPIVDLAVVSESTYWNASCLDRPAHCNSFSRHLALRLSGDRFGTVAERILYKTALRRGFSSPVWVNERTARLIGVEVKKSELENFTGFVGEVADANNNTERYIHLSDMQEPSTIIARFPFTFSSHAKEFHWVLRHKWNAVGAPKVTSLFDKIYESRSSQIADLDGQTISSSGTKKVSRKDKNVARLLGAKLWIELDEAILHGWSPKEGAKMIELNRSQGVVNIVPMTETSASSIQQKASEASDDEDKTAIDLDFNSNTNDLIARNTESVDFENMVPTSKNKKKKRSRLSYSKRKWYNAMQTTDPTKVIGLAYYFYRPKAS